MFPTACTLLETPSHPSYPWYCGQVSQERRATPTSSGLPVPMCITGRKDSPAAAAAAARTSKRSTAIPPELGSSPGPGAAVYTSSTVPSGQGTMARSRKGRGASAEAEPLQAGAGRSAHTNTHRGAGNEKEDQDCPFPITYQYIETTCARGRIYGGKIATNELHNGFSEAQERRVEKKRKSSTKREWRSQDALTHTRALGSQMGSAATADPQTPCWG